MVTTLSERTQKHIVRHKNLKPLKVSANTQKRQTNLSLVFRCLRLLPLRNIYSGQWSFPLPKEHSYERNAESETEFYGTYIFSTTMAAAEVLLVRLKAVSNVQKETSCKKKSQWGECAEMHNTTAHEVSSSIPCRS